MNAQKNPNAWSCLPTAFAIALSVEVENLIAQIGHDGSEITHAGLPEPLRRRGFHPQECIEVCLRDAIAVTQIDAVPSAVPIHSPQPEPKIFSTITGETNQNRFLRHLFHSYGVIDCRTQTGIGHALAYRGYGNYVQIADPAGGDILEFQRDMDFKMWGLFLVSLYRLDDITEG